MAVVSGVVTSGRDEHQPISLQLAAGFDLVAT